MMILGFEEYCIFSPERLIEEIGAWIEDIFTPRETVLVLVFCHGVWVTAENQRQELFSM